MPSLTAPITAIWLFGVAPGLYLDFATSSFQVPTKTGLPAVWANTAMETRANNSTATRTGTRFIALSFRKGSLAYQVRGISFVFTDVFDEFRIGHQIEAGIDGPRPGIRL